MRILVIHGPTLNRLGKRDPARYGSRTLASVNDGLLARASALSVELDHVQSNHEGVLVDWLHERVDAADAIIINPASLTPYGRSLAQAVNESGCTVVMVHISSACKDAKPGRIDSFAEVADAVITGLGTHGYQVAMEHLARRSQRQKMSSSTA